MKNNTKRKILWGDEDEDEDWGKSVVLPPRSVEIPKGGIRRRTFYLSFGFKQNLPQRVCVGKIVNR